MFSQEVLVSIYRHHHKRKHLGLGQVSQTTDGGSDGGSSSSGNGVSTTSNGLLAGLAVPDTSSTSLNGSLTTERAVVLGVLLDFHLLGLSSQGRTISDTKLTSDTDLLSSFSPVLVSICCGMALSGVAAVAWGVKNLLPASGQSTWPHCGSSLQSLEQLAGPCSGLRWWLGGTKVGWVNIHFAVLLRWVKKNKQNYLLFLAVSCERTVNFS